MEKYRIDKPTEKDREHIIQGLMNYNWSQVQPIEEKEIIDISRKMLDEEGNVIAGLIGRMYGWGCAYVDILWVDEGHRKEGLGSRLIAEAEAFLKENGGYLLHLDTFDFQAKDFYLKNGFEVFGTLDDCPKGHKRYFLKKLIGEV